MQAPSSGRSRSWSNDDNDDVEQMQKEEVVLDTEEQHEFSRNENNTVDSCSVLFRLKQLQDENQALKSEVEALQARWSAFQRTASEDDILALSSNLEPGSPTINKSKKKLRRRSKLHKSEAEREAVKKKKKARGMRYPPHIQDT